MGKNELICKVVGTIMSDKGFELETDRRTYWRWTKYFLGIKEDVTIMDMQQIIRLTIGKAIHGVAFVMGDELLYTLDNPRTKKEEWFYYSCEKEQRQVKYENILYDIRDILIKNCDRLLEQHVEKVKAAVPNKIHFEKLCRNYEKLVEKYSNEYEMENKNILEILDIIMYQISCMFDKEKQDVEDDLLGFAAVLYHEMEKQYGGKKEVDEEIETIMLVNIGKHKASFCFLRDVFSMWESTEYFSQYRKNFICWYNRENDL